MPHHLYVRFIRLPLLFRVLLMTAILICFFGLIIHLIEPENFPTIMDGVWWAIITASTVGYGDYVPLTFPGRITAIFLLLVGAGFLTAYFATLSTVAVTKQDEYQKGESVYKGKEHYIIIGWNERSREVIKSFSDEKQHVILIDDSLKSNPLPFQHLHFVKGRAQEDEVLIRANIKEAKKVIITADQRLDELQADMNTILTLLAVKGLNPNILCIAEILTTEQLNNARRAGADEIIKTNKLTSIIILDSIRTPGMVQPLSDFLSGLSGRKIEYQPSTGETIGKSFNQACLLVHSRGKILLGVKKGEEVLINPQHKVTIEKEDHLLLINK